MGGEVYWAWLHCVEEMSGRDSCSHRPSFRFTIASSGDDTQKHDHDEDSELRGSRRRGNDRKHNPKCAEALALPAGSSISDRT
jgi:hypothetical protein